MSKNFADSTVATAPSPATSGTSLTVASGHGTKFYNGKAFIAPASGRPTPTTAEVVTITNIVGDVLTITRNTEAGTARTVVVGDLIYQGLTAAMIDSVLLGNNSLILGETPSGSTNGSNTTFTAVNAYVAGSIAVYVGGIRQRLTTDYAETTPSSGIITMVAAPAIGQSVKVDYLRSINVTGNADTVDGIHANTTATANQLLPLNASSIFPQTVIASPQLGRAILTTPFSTGASSATQVTGTVNGVGSANMRVTATAPGGRDIKITVAGDTMYNIANGTRVFLTIWKNGVGTGTQIGETRAAMAAAAQEAPVSMVVIDPLPSAGSVQYDLALHANGGGTATVTAGTGAQVTLLVEVS